ncbi:MAG: AraD1 family protein [Candidatus Sumerlaeaceae bacterium]
MLSLVQLRNTSGERRVALVQEPKLVLLNAKFGSVYELALNAARDEVALAELATQSLDATSIEYDPIYEGSDPEWRLLQAFDHPEEPARCLVTGTGLTHKASAENRQAMHSATAPVSDSMKMYMWGKEGGRPQTGCVGTQPEWFYKGCGTVLRAHGEALEVPSFAGDGGEESEIAGLYIVDDDGNPRRVGMAVTNEFSDHVLEEKNYLYLAPSKLRTCSIGPELIVEPDFSGNRGKATIRRGDRVVWSTEFFTGDAHMCHTVANLEHHHFKVPQHRRPGDAHVYFYGTDAFSFGDRILMQDGDVMQIEVEQFGRPLRNPIRFDPSTEQFVEVRPL